MHAYMTVTFARERRREDLGITTLDELAERSSSSSPLLSSLELSDTQVYEP